MRGQKQHFRLPLLSRKSNARSFLTLSEERSLICPLCPRFFFFFFKNTYGRYCEQSSLSSSPCGSKPCYNDGQCIRQDANSYTCQCGASNGGQSCKQSLIGACASNPCQRDGICVPIGLTGKSSLNLSCRHYSKTMSSLSLTL